jgi:hypothetical protein
MRVLYLPDEEVDEETNVLAYASDTRQTDKRSKPKPSWPSNIRRVGRIPLLHGSSTCDGALNIATSAAEPSAPRLNKSAE